MASLKEQKEAFVTGHSGTTPSEILLVCISAPLGIYLFNEIHRRVLLSFCSSSSNNNAGVNNAILVFIEAIVLLLPMAICQTSLLYPWGQVLLGIEVILAICLHIGRIRQQPDTASSNVDTDAKKPKLAFLSSYRSTVSYLTFVAILAVDFHVFPRRFAKTETIGYGLMDLGAGSFIVSGGFVSWYARRSSSSTNKEGDGITYWGALRPALVRSIPLLVMGMIRLLTTKGLEYQEHVSEYGVHWNFFFTLMVVSVLSIMFRFDTTQLVDSKSFVHKVLPWMLLAFHQASLSLYGMQEYMEDGERHCGEKKGTSAVCDFFAANREGILGCIGYLCMYSISEDIAHYGIWSAKFPSQRGKRLSICCISLWAVHWFLRSILDIQVSRRSTNATFVAWALAHNVTILLLIWAAFFLADDSTVSPIFDAVNRHGLIVFILANLMTGLVNLSINTLAVADAQALGVIFAYLFAVGTVALLIDWALSRRPKAKQG